MVHSCRNGRQKVIILAVHPHNVEENLTFRLEKTTLKGKTNKLVFTHWLNLGVDQNYCHISYNQLTDCEKKTFHTTLANDKEHIHIQGIHIHPYNDTIFALNCDNKQHIGKNLDWKIML